jgi:hypothetical protein
VRGSTSLAIAALAAALAGDAPASITGVCPDGSFFVVQSAEDVPCRDAKQVAPEDLPPLKPELLPRPYGWEVFQRRNDPNNPYNLVDAPPNGGDARATSAEEARETASAEAQPEVSAPPPPEPTAPPAPPDARPGLALGDAELRDLAQIVALSQERAPAAPVRGR